MASGVGGTIRFSGIVIGFAALGAVLYQRILGVICASLGPEHSTAAAALARAVASGKLTAGGDAALATQAFGAGYQTMLFSAATFAILSAIISWFCIGGDETRPIPKRHNGNRSSIMPVE